MSMEEEMDVLTFVFFCLSSAFSTYYFCMMITIPPRLWGMTIHRCWVRNIISKVAAKIRDVFGTGRKYNGPDDHWFDVDKWGQAPPGKYDIWTMGGEPRDYLDDREDQSDILQKPHTSSVKNDVSFDNWWDRVQKVSMRTPFEPPNFLPQNDVLSRSSVEDNMSNVSWSDVRRFYDSMCDYIGSQKKLSSTDEHVMKFFRIWYCKRADQIEMIYELSNEKIEQMLKCLPQCRQKLRLLSMLYYSRTYNRDNEQWSRWADGEEFDLILRVEFAKFTPEETASVRKEMADTFNHGKLNKNTPLPPLRKHFYAWAWEVTEPDSQVS